MARIWRAKSAEGCVPQDAISAMPAAGISPLDAPPGPAVAASAAGKVSVLLRHAGSLWCCRAALWASCSVLALACGARTADCAPALAAAFLCVGLVAAPIAVDAARAFSSDERAPDDVAPNGEVVIALASAALAQCALICMTKRHAAEIEAIKKTQPQCKAESLEPKLTSPADTRLRGGHTLGPAAEAPAMEALDLRAAAARLEEQGEGGTSALPVGATVSADLGGADPHVHVAHAPSMHNVPSNITSATAEDHWSDDEDSILHVDPAGGQSAADVALNVAPHAPPARAVAPIPEPPIDRLRADDAAPLGIGIGERLITSRLLPRDAPPRPTSR